MERHSNDGLEYFAPHGKVMAALQLLEFDLVALALIQIGEGLLVDLGRNGRGCPQHILKSEIKWIRRIK